MSFFGLKLDGLAKSQVMPTSGILWDTKSWSNRISWFIRATSLGSLQGRHSRESGSLHRGGIDFPGFPLPDRSRGQASREWWKQVISDFSGIHQTWIGN